MPAFQEIPVDDVGKIRFYIVPDDTNVAHQAVINLAKAGRGLLLRSLNGGDAGACDLAHVVVDTAKAALEVWLDDGITEGHCHYHKVDVVKAGLSLVPFGDATRISISFLVPEALRAAR